MSSNEQFDFSDICFHTFVFIPTHKHFFTEISKHQHAYSINLLFINFTYLATDRNVKSCSNKLRTAFQALNRNDQVVEASVTNLETYVCPITS